MNVRECCLFPFLEKRLFIPGIVLTWPKGNEYNSASTRLLIDGNRAAAIRYSQAVEVHRNGQ